MELTELPFTFRGRIFRSAMPFSSYDPEGKLIPAFTENDISLIVMLVSDEECLRVTGRNLHEAYQAKGFEIIHLPIQDFNIPELVEVREAIHSVLSYSQSGAGVAIHCHAGIGRTGMFAACLAKLGMNYPSDEAIRWVREFIPGAVEVPDQERLVRMV